MSVMSAASAASKIMQTINNKCNRVTLTVMIPPGNNNNANNTAPPALAGKAAVTNNSALHKSSAVAMLNTARSSLFNAPTKQTLVAVHTSSGSSSSNSTNSSANSGSNASATAAVPADVFTPTVSTPVASTPATAALHQFLTLLSPSAALLATPLCSSLSSLPLFPFATPNKLATLSPIAEHDSNARNLRSYAAAAAATPIPASQPSQQLHRVAGSTVSLAPILSPTAAAVAAELFSAAAVNNSSPLSLLNSAESSPCTVDSWPLSGTSALELDQLPESDLPPSRSPVASPSACSYAELEDVKYLSLNSDDCVEPATPHSQQPFSNTLDMHLSPPSSFSQLSHSNNNSPQRSMIPSLPRSHSADFTYHTTAMHDITAAEQFSSSPSTASLHSSYSMDNISLMQQQVVNNSVHAVHANSSIHNSGCHYSGSYNELHAAHIRASASVHRVLAYNALPVRADLYSRDERAMKLQRYREKRARRVWNKRVLYQVRKTFADGRPRVGGRFIKKTDEQLEAAKAAPHTLSMQLSSEARIQRAFA